MIEILLLRQVIVVVGTALAAFSDTKTGLIFDEITYPMILFGVLFSLVELNFNAFLLAAVVFAFGYTLYFAGKIGGGDVKLFVGLTLLMPFLNGSIFILNVLVISGLISVIFLSVYYLAKYLKKGIKISENLESIKKAFVFLLVLIAYFYFGYSNNLFSLNFVLFLGTPCLFALAFVALEKGIKKHFFLQKISLKELEEDDLIATEFLDEETRKKLSLKFKGIIDESTEKKLKELNVKNVLVYRNLPKFAPFVLIGVIVSILFPDLFLLVFS